MLKLVFGRRTPQALLLPLSLQPLVTPTRPLTPIRPRQLLHPLTPERFLRLSGFLTRQPTPLFLQTL